MSNEFDHTFGGVFAEYVPDVWKHRWLATIAFNDIAGGVPSDQKVAEGWIRSKLGGDAAKDSRIKEAVAQMMESRKISEDEAIAELNASRNVNGFWRNSDGQLFIQGRTIKAALKEAVSVAVAAGNLPARKWGTTNKGAMSFAAEHLQVLTEEVRLWHPRLADEGSDVPLRPVMEPTLIQQTFPVNPITRQTGIQYTEICKGVIIEVEVATDCEDYTDKEWATIWLTGNLQGIGAARSQDHGRYSVIGWEKISQ